MDFEIEVQRLLKLKGYQVSRNQIVSGTQTDLMAMYAGDGLSNLCLLVECTDRTGQIGIALVKEKAAILISLKDSRYLYRLLFVSRDGFTPEARVYADATPQIKLMSLADLERDLVDFTPYVLWYVENYESSSGLFKEGSLYSTYVELKGRDGQDESIPSLTAYCKKWLDNPNERLLFLLGEFGAGKTSFCRHFVYDLVSKRARSSSPSYEALPVLINLREFRGGTLNLEQIITSVLVNDYGVRLTSFRAFERVAAGGRIALVLDGFDEMAEKADVRTLVHCFGQIHLLAAVDLKVILTCRSNFFQSHADIVGLFKQFRIDLPAASGTSDASVTLDFEQRARTIYVEPFAPEQVEAFVRKRVGRQADNVLKKLRQIHDLQDLSRRPVLLDMIVTTLPELGKADRPINSAALYEHYTDRWTSRDAWRVAMPLAVRQQFCDVLSWHMHRAGSQDIDFTMLEAVMINTLGELTTSPEELDRFKNDIQTCSFLVRSAGGNEFRFAHKSFVEFFVGRTLIDHLTKNESIPPKKELPPILLPFTVGLGGSSSFWTIDNSDAFRGITIPIFAERLWSPFLRTTPINVREHFDTKMRQVFESKSGMATMEVSEEIATFAMEYASNHDVVFSSLVTSLTRPDLIQLLSEIFRATRATDVLTANADFLKEYVVNGPDPLIRVAFCAALARIPEVSDTEFLRRSHAAVDPDGWSYFLFSLAASNSAHARSLVRYCFDEISDLSVVNRLICARALRDENVGSWKELLPESFVDELIRSKDDNEQLLAVQICEGMPHLPPDLLKVLIRLLDEARSDGVKDAAVNAIAYSSPDGWKMLRAVRQKVRDPRSAERLRIVEQRMRDELSVQRNRPPRDEREKRRLVLDALWKRSH
jgi:hypothetical protein